MRLIVFICCLGLTALLVALYIAQHNWLTELRIRVLVLEKELRIEEAEHRRLELQMASFMSPVRLEEVAKKAQYSHLRQPSVNDIIP